METYAEVWIDRKVPSEPELIAQFRFTDMALESAGAMCARYKWRTIVKYVNQSNGPFPDRVFEWGRKTVEGVVQKRG